MRRALRFAGLLIVVALVASGACLLTRHMARPTPVDAHAWIHEQLGITAEQERELAPIEERYAARKQELAARIDRANAELAQVILEDKESTARVNAVIDRIHAAQGELQMVTLAHVFEMKPVLRPDQFEKLLHLTADALNSHSGAAH